MGMSVSDPARTPDPRDPRHSREYLAAERWTADRVRRELLDEARPSPRYEFLDGTLIVSPSPSFAHQAIVAHLVALLAAYLRRHAIGGVITSPSDVEVAPNTVAQPDLFVVPMAEWRRLVGRGGAAPARALWLAVEVLSPSSVRTDRLTKRRFYGRAGVPEYWVVDPESREIYRHVLVEGRYEVQVVAPGQECPVETLPFPYVLRPSVLDPRHPAT
jgi:Uma2 family endonuclease